MAPLIKVSVLMPVHNGADYLKASIESVLGQSLREFEFFITDNSSTDETAKIVGSYHDPRIVFKINERNEGLFPGLNALIRRSRAPLIKPWSHDDIMTADCLEKGYRFYESHPGLGCFYANCDTIDAGGNLVAGPPADETPAILSPETADRYCLLHGCLSPNVSNLFFPRSIFDAMGFFREDWIAADFDMMVRVQNHYPIGRIAEVLLHLRRHPKQWSTNPRSVMQYLGEEPLIYEALRERLLHRHASMSLPEISGALRRKYVQYFHAAVRYLCGGRVKDAWDVFRRLGRIEPLPVLFGLWLCELPGRFGKVRRP